MLTAAQVESEILRLSEGLEDATRDLASLTEVAAHNEVEYKRTFARAFLSSEGAGIMREQQATLDASDALLARRLADGVVSSQVEVLRTMRTQIDALRTIAVNVRAVT